VRIAIVENNTSGISMKGNIKLMILMAGIFLISGSLFSQDTIGLNEYKKEYSWYISTTTAEKVSDPKNTYGSIDFKPKSFEEIPFEIDLTHFQFYRISGTFEILVLKPMDLIESEFKSVKK
jgi:hypothetical protein